MDNLINEAISYLDQLIHIKSNTKDRVKDVETRFIENTTDDTQSYYEYTCYDENGDFVISFAVNKDGSVELVDDNDCY